MFRVVTVKVTDTVGHIAIAVPTEIGLHWNRRCAMGFGSLKINCEGVELQ
jgi:hypothetical protein